MHGMFRLSLAAGLFVAAAAVWGQSPGALKDSRAFYQDVAGYHAQGRAEAADRAEAQRLAKSAALKRLFAEMGKDAMFAEMCISGWPEYITVEDAVSREDNGRHFAQVQVVVATSAVMMTEQRYQVAVAALLGQAEQAMASVEAQLGEAEAFERNLEVAEALGAYRRARTGTAEARELVKGVGDRSAVSENGSTIVAIAARLEALGVRVAGGLERMQAIEAEARSSAAADELTKAIDLYERELAEMEAGAAEYAALSPFYDLPRARLDAILLEVQSSRTKSGRVMEELGKLRATIPPERGFLRQKAELSLQDATALARRLERMEGELRQEIATPRLVRQERAQRRRAALAAAGSVARYVFLHRPADVATVRWELPLAWDMEGPVRATGEADLSVDVDGVFPGGFWIRGSAARETVVDRAGADTSWNGAWRSGVDLGFGKRTMVGLGLSWDWRREVVDLVAGGAAAEAERELELRFDLGGLDLEGRRLRWLASLGTTLPTVPAGVILIPYHLNARLAFMARAGDVLVLWGTVRTGARQSAPWREGEPFADSFSYRLDWGVGVGLRLPPPFIVGLSYGGTVTAELGPQGLVAPDPHAAAWSVTLGYAF